MNENTYPLAAIGAGQIATSYPYGIETRPYPTQRIEHVTDLASIALATAVPLRALWILPGDPIAQRAKDPAFWAPRERWDIFATGSQGGSRSTARVSYINEHSKKSRSIQIFSEVDSTNRWGLQPNDVRHLAFLVATYERLMGVEVLFSPAQTALAALKNTCDVSTRRSWIFPLAKATITDLPTAPEVAPQHVNPLPISGKFVHVFDGNAAYMRAAKHGFGTGEPVWLASKEEITTRLAVKGIDGLTRVCQGKEYGLWCVTAFKRDADLYDHLPSPWGNRGGNPDQEWFTTPQVTLAYQQGWYIMFHQGYHWPARQQLMMNWVDQMWEARQRVKGSQSEALIKRSFNRAVGMMAHPLHDEQKTVPWYCRRDWAGTIWAQNYLLQCIKIATIEKQHPGYLCVDTDQIAWISDEVDVRNALPGILDRSDQLGGYKHVVTLAGRDAQQVIDMAQAGTSLTPLLTAFLAARRNLSLVEVVD